VGTGIIFSMTDTPFASRPTVFVVDDEEEIAHMLAVILQLNLYDAIPYSDPTTALTDAKERQPEYLITDICMPTMNGIELAISLRKEVPSCKVLLFSGQSEAAAMLEKSKSEGNNFRLAQKPLHPKQLIEILLEL
jgi:FixJ family two-component response regulator